MEDRHLVLTAVSEKNFSTTDKIVNLTQVQTHCSVAHSLGEKIVVTNGCFDLLHVGHVAFLEAASSLGGILIVGVNTDRAVNKLKGPRRPYIQAYDRARLVAALQCVDLVTLIDDVRVTELLSTCGPATWVKGGDYTLATLNKAEVKAIKACSGKIKIIPSTSGYSTTEIIRRIKDET